jgi:hypothetical protein
VSEVEDEKKKWFPSLQLFGGGDLPFWDALTCQSQNLLPQ